jgi:VWFA-related protein
MMRTLCFTALAGAAVIAAPQDRQTFRVSTRLIPIDVVVHKDGQPVADLTAADFRISEDGKEQRIEFFSVIDARTASPALPAPPALPANEATNRPSGRIPATATVVLFDRLNTRFEDQVKAREEIISFLSRMKPDDRVALYVLDSNEIRVLHDFTRDSAALVKTMSRYRAATSPELAAADAPAAPVAPIGNADIDADTARWLEETRSMVAAQRVVDAGKTTLEGLELIANHLAGISGRKNLVWVSSSFPLRIDDGLEHRTLTAELTRAVRAVTTAGIAIYPVDTRGLIAPFQGVKPTETLTGIGKSAPNIPNPSGLSNMPVVDTMSELAIRTGGRVFYNTNAIGAAIGKAMDDSRVTYVIGYYPTNEKFDGRFRDLKVSVRRPGVEVRHRSGYIATPAGATKNETLVNIARRALEATGVGLTVNTDGNNVTIRVDPASITMTPVIAGNFDVALDLLIVQRRPNGAVETDFAKTLNLRLTTAQRDQLLKDGFSMTRTISRIPDATLHVVVRDQPSGAAGSVTIARAIDPR